MRDIRRMAMPIVLALSMAILPACGTSGSGKQTPEPAEEPTAESVSATASWDAEESVPVYRDTTGSAESVTVRMRDDIPYMKIDEFYNKLYFTGADQYPEKAQQMVVTHEGSVYEAPAFNGTKATFDVDADTFVCENLDAYTMTPYYALFLAEQADPSAPFVRVSGTDYTGDVTPRSVDLKSYGIDLVADGDELWVPLPTLECIFCYPYVYDVYYNGQSIYMYDGMSILQTTSAKDTDENYYDFLEDERSAERIAFDYGNLCFYVDTFYGYPASSRLCESIRAEGLDKTLDKTIDGMKLSGIKELLKSADMVEYAIGLDSLFNKALDDGGHTGFVELSWVSKVPQEKITELTPKVAELSLTRNANTLKSQETAEELQAALGQVMDEGGFEGETMQYADGSGFAVYMEQGDTAMFVLSDHYDIDRPGWVAYENGETSEMPQDSMGTFMQALDKAKANPDIKNFVVNIALCGGGESGISTTISKIACGQAYRHQFNEFSGQDEVIHYDVDANFDGAFDDLDDEVSYPFNFAVVASAQSYSATNYLASMAKDNGVCLLGETTGGGANAPQVTPEAEGFSINLSAGFKVMDKNNQHVDFGVEPDYVLTQEKDGAKDYSQYFDLATISQLVNEFYSE